MIDNAAEPRRLIRLMIGGRVQGVGYRAWLQREALALGLSGWVRNRANGDVEAILSGTPKAVQSMCDICLSGPPHARVDHVLKSEAAPSDQGAGPGGFIILPTL